MDAKEKSWVASLEHRLGRLETLLERAVESLDGMARHVHMVENHANELTGAAGKSYENCDEPVCVDAKKAWKSKRS
jgi:hypothetical protein